MPISVGYTGWNGSQSTSATSQATTFSGATTTGSTFIVLVSSRGTTAPSSISGTIGGLADGNTYTLAKSETAGYFGTWLYYCINGNGGSSHVITATWAAASTNLLVGLAEFKGVGAGTFDTAPAGTTNTAGSLTGTAPSITTTVANELVVDTFTTYGAQTQTITDSGAGFSIAVDYASFSYNDGAISWAVPASSGTAAADTYSWTANEYTNYLSLSIKPAAGGSSATGASTTTDGADTMSASGGIATAGTSATADGADTMSASGGIASSGTSATTDGADTMSAAGTAGAAGTSGTTDGDDTVSAAGGIATAGASATTDGADTTAASGSIATAGSSATTDGADTATASGGIATAGTSATTDDVDVMSAAGSAGASGVGSAAMSDGADTMDATTPRGGAGRVLPTRKRRKRYVVEDGLEVLYFDTEPQALAAIQARKEVRATEGAPPVQEEPREEELEEAIADPEPLLPDTDFRAHEFAGEEEAVARWHIQQERAHHRAILEHIAQIIGALLDEAA